MLLAKSTRTRGREGKGRGRQGTFHPSRFSNPTGTLPQDYLIVNKKTSSPTEGRPPILCGCIRVSGKRAGGRGRTATASPLPPRVGGRKMRLVQPSTAAWKRPACRTGPPLTWNLPCRHGYKGGSEQPRPWSVYSARGEQNQTGPPEAGGSLLCGIESQPGGTGIFKGIGRERC